MGDPPPPEKPTALMRILLGLVIAILASYTAVPVILVVAFLFALGLTCGAAVALEHTGTLDDAAAFEIATWTAVVALALFFIVAFAHRRLAPQAKGTLAIVLRSPVVTTFIVLPIVTALVLWIAWDRTALAALAGALVLADLYFFSIAALVGMLYVAWLGCVEVYSVGAASKYRSGLTTGLLLTPLAALLVVGHAVAPPTPSHAATRESWSARVAPASAPGILESERRGLHLLDQALEQTHATPPSPPAISSNGTATTATVSPPADPRPTATATTSPPPAAPTEAASPWETEGEGESTDRLVRACMKELASPQDGGRSQIDQVRRYLEAKYNLRPGDAHDIVSDALFNVCEAHARRPDVYRRLGAVLRTAGERRVPRWRRGNHRSCPIGGEIPSCTPSADETVRFKGEDDIINASICKEDEVTLEILYMRVIEGKRFRAIGLELDPPLSEDETRSKYNNARGRLQKLLRDTCGP